jgi:hypothetical protein
MALLPSLATKIENTTQQRNQTHPLKKGLLQQPFVSWIITKINTASNRTENPIGIIRPMRIIF